jgi:hypothetical protein
MYDNYFEDIEQRVNEFRRHFGIDPTQPLAVEKLYDVLKREYKYRIDKVTLGLYPDLRSVRALAQPEKKRLFVNGQLDPTQERFLLAKELGYRYLKLKERPFTTNLMKVASFEEALNNFRSSYFAGALLLPEAEMHQQLTAFFGSDRWDTPAFLGLKQHYQTSPEMFLQRLTTLLPRYFGIQDLFFLRFNHSPGTDRFLLTKELHLARQHQPHGTETNEHYCRRWVTIWLLRDLQKVQQESNSREPVICAIQRSRYIGSEDEYLVITIARSGHPTPNTNVSVSLGIALNEHARKVLRFLDDPAIPFRYVSQTCERCSSTDCQERAAPATVLEYERRQERIEQAVRELMS